MKKPEKMKPLTFTGSPEVNSSEINKIISNYNNLVEVVNMILEEMAPFGQDKFND